MEKHVEKRKFPRIETHIPLKYHKLGDTAGRSKAGVITRNLSEGGVRFKAAEFISMACRLVLEMDMPMFTKPIKAISKVAWIRKTPSGEDYEVGNQFLEMSKKDRGLVSEYINSLVLYNDPESENARSAEDSKGDDAHRE
jgi:c-di-GMP-binding flagellar brake protein YcgR